MLKSEIRMELVHHIVGAEMNPSKVKNRAIFLPELKL